MSKLRKTLFLLAIPLTIGTLKADDAIWSTSRLEREICGEDTWYGFNRTMFGLERLVMDYVADPLCTVYCSIVPRPLVEAIDNAVDNILYPSRLGATLCRAEWRGAWDETQRFAVNTTLGFGGLFDPALDWFGLVSTDATFSGTFAAWGIGRGKTLILPFVPRGNIRDAFGYAVDKCLDPRIALDILFPTGIPISWSAGFWPNNAAVWIDPWRDNIADQARPYETYRQLFAAKSLLDEKLSVYRTSRASLDGSLPTRRPPVRAPLTRPDNLQGRWRDVPDFMPRTPALDTLRSRLFGPEKDNDRWWMRHGIFNRDFAKGVCERAVAVTTNTPPAQYGYVPVVSDAPVSPAKRIVFVVPGVGGTHSSRATLGIAEILHRAGAAVILCDDPFHWRYMLSANGGKLPGYLPDDARRFAAFIRAVLADLHKDGLIADPEVSVIGWSMGGLVTAHLAAIDEREGLGFGTGRFLAVNPPVSFESISEAVDSFLAPTRDWNLDEVTTNFVEITSRLAVWSAQHRDLSPDISEEDARFTVAVALGATLPDLVALSTGTNVDVTVRNYIRDHLAAEHPGVDPAVLAERAGLRSIEKELHVSHRLNMIHTRDDFLLSDGDREFLDRTLGDRITWFSVGAHCGMFYTREFKDEILTRLGFR